MVISGIRSLAGLNGVALADIGIQNICIPGYIGVCPIVSPCSGSSSGVPGMPRKRPGEARFGICGGEGPNLNEPQKGEAGAAMETVADLLPPHPVSKLVTP